MNQMNIMKYTKRDTCNITLNNYSESRPQLRKLFKYSCCYCTVHEGENRLGFFHIDHFKPKSLFSKLENTYENLYYACHKCNVHKKNNWISTDDGCIRDCDMCKHKVCESTNVPRFIDPCMDQPSDFIEYDDNTFQIKAKNNSVVGNYTINMLRLNRIQLIRLRKARRNLLMWLEAEKEKLSYCQDKLESAIKQQEKFEKILTNYQEGDVSKDSSLLAEALSKLLKQKVLIYQKQFIEIEQELQKVADVVYDTAAPFEW